MNIDRVINFLSAGVMALTLAGCGGGGGSSQNNSPAFSIDRTTVSMTADTADGFSSPSTQLQLRVSNVPASGFYYRYRFQGTAVSSFNLYSTGSDTYAVTLYLYAPTVMGAGTYTDSVQIELCTDSACASQFSGSPATVAVTYKVTGNAQPVATFSLDSQSVNVESAADGTVVAPQVQMYVYNSPPYTTYMSVARQSKSVVSQVSGESTSNGVRWTFNLKGKDALGAGIFQESIRFRLCFLSDCSLLSSDSPRYLPLRYNLLAEEGQEFTKRSVSGQPAGLAYDATRAKLYAAFRAVSSTAGTFVRIDPLTGQTEATLNLSGQPEMMALSDDGLYGYVVLTQTGSNSIVTQQIAKLDLSSLAILQTINVPASYAYSTYIKAITVVPGHPEQLALTMQASSFSGIAIYVAGSKVAELPYQNVGEANALQWSSSSRLHFYPASPDTLYTYDFNGSALHELSEHANFNSGCTAYGYIYGCNGGGIRYSSGKLYSDVGTVYDVAGDVVTGQFALPSSNMRSFMTVANGHAYYLYYWYPSMRMISMDIASLQPIVEARLPDLSINYYSGGTQVVSWGTDGLAFNATDRIVIMKGSFVTQAYVSPGSSSILRAADTAILSSTPDHRTRSAIQNGDTPSTL